jgi:hypothetical protein
MVIRAVIAVENSEGRQDFAQPASSFRQSVAPYPATDWEMSVTSIETPGPMVEEMATFLR